MINIYEILIITLFHIIFINPLEKLLVQKYYKTINRPYIKIKCEKFNSLGMPSGHAESTTVIMMLLYLNNYINLNVALFMIIFVSLQRVFSFMHCIKQVLMGFFIGLIMSFIYNKLNSFINCLIFIFIYISILSYLYFIYRIPN